MLNGKRLSYLLKSISDFNPERDEAIAFFEEEMRKVRLSKYEAQALNVIERFSATLG